MIKCDVCGKKSLLPEKFENTNICKMCFIKINGPTWKYKSISNKNIAESQREKILAIASNHQFPLNVIDDINKYFDMQINKMHKCEACNEIVMNTVNIGGALICNNCFSKINIPAYKQQKYISINELNENKAKVLDLATKSNFPQNAIKEIKNIFDKKVETEKGWMYTIDGGEGQVLKVYEKYCTIITSPNFDTDSIAIRYGLLEKKNRPIQIKESGIDTASIVSGVLRGGIIKTGVSLVASQFIDSAFNEPIPKKKDFVVHKGEQELSLEYYDIIQFSELDNNDIGYIKFQTMQTLNNDEKDVLFFYGKNASKNIKMAMPNIYKAILNNIKNIKYNTNDTVNKSNTELIDNEKIANDILKFKNLLDIGAITQEEYDAKKKEILGL